MANSVTSKSTLSAEAAHVAQLDGQAGNGSFSNRAYRLKAEESIGSRSSNGTLLAATTLLCLAVLVLGVRFGKRRVIQEQPKGSGDLGSRVAAGPFALLLSHEERIAALKEAVKDAKQSLQRKKEWLAGLQKECDEAIETTKLLRDATRELRRHADSSLVERSKFIEALESAKVKVHKGQTQDLANALEKQREILQREEAIAAKRRRDVSDMNRQWRIAHEHEEAALKKALASLVEASREHRISLQAMEDVETYVKQCAATLENLKARESHLEANSNLQRWENSFQHASLSNVVLQEDFRKQQAGMLVASQVRARELVREILMQLRSFRKENLSRSGAEWPESVVLGERVDKVVKRHASACQLIPAQMATSWDIILNTAAVKLGISVILNDYQLAWELSQAKEVCKLEGKQMVGGFDASELATKHVEAFKEELRGRLENVQQAEEYQKSVLAAEKEADLLLQECRLEGSPECILVRGFKSVDSDEADPGTDAEFRVLRGLGSGASGVVVEVEPVDQELRDKVGALAMKILRERIPQEKIVSESDLIEEVMQEFESAFLSEKNALKKIAFEGEGVAAVTERTGVIGAHYAGRVEGLNAAVKSSDSSVIVSIDHVTFSPVIALDISHLFLPVVKAGLSMESRVYIARSILTTMAHIHSAGAVHNDIRLENAGITANGRIVVFDCANFERPGEPRLWSSATNTSPESAELALRGGSRTGSFSEDAWGLGFMLYMIFTEGVAAFQDSDPGFLDGITSYRGLNAEWLMHNVESPTFQLRRYGVPDIWIQAISLLLERNGKHRPTVMQVLQAFPELLEGPLKALESEDRAF